MPFYDRHLLIRGFHSFQLSQNKTQTRFHEKGLRLHCEHVFRYMMIVGARWDS